MKVLELVVSVDLTDQGTNTSVEVKTKESGDPVADAVVEAISQGVPMLVSKITGKVSDIMTESGVDNKVIRVERGGQMP